MSEDSDVRGQQGMDLCTSESVIMDYALVLCARTLILTAPIHCRGSIGEQVM